MQLHLYFVVIFLNEKLRIAVVYLVDFALEVALLCSVVSFLCYRVRKHHPLFCQICTDKILQDRSNVKFYIEYLRRRFSCLEKGGYPCSLPKCIK